MTDANIPTQRSLSFKMTCRSIFFILALGCVCIIAHAGFMPSPAFAQQRLTGAEIRETLVEKILDRGQGYDLAWRINSNGTLDTIEGGVVVYSSNWSIDDDQFCTYAAEDANYKECYYVSQDWAIITLTRVKDGVAEDWSLVDPNDTTQAPWPILTGEEIKQQLVDGVLNSDDGSGIAWEIHPEGKLEVFEDGTLVSTEKWQIDGDDFCRVTSGEEFCYLVEKEVGGNGVRLNESEWILVHAQ